MAEPKLSADDKALLSMRADEFQVALARGSSGDWSPYLEGLDGAVRLAALAELAAIELNHRWENGEQPTLAEYVERFPELGPHGSEPSTLVEEYERCRDRAGHSAMATQRSNVMPKPMERIVPPPSPEIEEEDPQMMVTRTVTSTPGKRPVVSGVQGGDGLLGVAQNYELIKELGRGAFGEVWLARKMPSGIKKAVKILHKPADDAAGQAELASLELIKNLRHPFLLSTEDFWIANNKLYIVTELADTSLRRRLVEAKEKGLPGIPEDELFRYMLESAEGFDYLHAEKITHRDVKPDNILIANGHAKVADFGLARQHEDELGAMSFAGTPAYMAPEVWGCEGGPPSDQYAFAMSYIELRQGRTPFKLGKVMEVMQAHMNGQFEFADFIGEAERAVLQRALAKDPIDRYPSCLAFAEELAEAAGRNIRRKTEPVAPPRPEYYESLRDVPPVVAPPAKQSKVWILAAAAVLIAAVALGAVFFKGNNDRGTKPEDGPVVEAKLPPGTRPHGDKRITIAGGRSLPDWIALDTNEKVRFRLVVPDPTGPRVEPFYMLQSKVWHKFYHDKGEGTHPVVDVTANQAAEFAAKHGGRLPTPAEWDHAAGYYSSTRGDGPYLPGSKVNMGIPSPEPTHGDDLPATASGLVDMAGNGREWTSGALNPDGSWSRVESFAPKQLAVLRGRNFTLRTPLSFDILKREQTEPQTQFADVPSPYTSFRIALPLPPE